MADGGDFIEVHAEDGGHGSDADRHGFLHVFAAVADGANGVGEGEGARGDMSGIFTETVTGDVAGLGNAGLEHAQHGNGDGENGGLGDFGEPELVFRSFEADGGKLVAEGVVGFFEGSAGGRIFFVEVFSHADGLGALAGEQEGDDVVVLICHEIVLSLRYFLLALRRAAGPTDREGETPSRQPARCRRYCLNATSNSVAELRFRWARGEARPSHARLNC